MAMWAKQVKTTSKCCFYLFRRSSPASKEAIALCGEPMGTSARSNTNVLQDESRPRSPIQTALYSRRRFSFIFKYLTEFGCYVFKNGTKGKFYELNDDIFQLKSIIFYFIYNFRNILYCERI